MSSSNQLMTSPDDVEGIEEEILDVIESADYSPKRVTMPGVYLSPAREIIISEKVVAKGPQIGKPYLSVAIRFVGGLQDAGGNVFNQGQYPLRDWVNTLPLQRRDFQTQQPFPGTTSSLAEYLKAVGINPKGMTREQAKEAAEVSASNPVFVRVGRSERSEKLLDGTYAKRKTYTRHWNVGTKDNPIWATEIADPTGSGATLQARETIEGYRKTA